MRTIENKRGRLGELSFCGENRELWAPTRRQSDDGATGRARADELLNYMRRNGAPMLLGHVADAIFEATGGQFGQVEIGFFHRLAEHALMSELELAPTAEERPKRVRPVLRLVHSVEAPVGA